MDPDEASLPCRTCDQRRGPNIANGTRCSTCGQKQACQLTVLGALSASSSYLLTNDLGAAVTVFAVALVTIPIGFVLAVLTHELTHALVARALGQAVSRVIIGEGAAVCRIGRDPQILIGSVFMGNGVTEISDVSRAWYRVRSGVVLLSAPLWSLAVAVAFWQVGGTPSLPLQTAAMVFAVANGLLGVITLIPVATFGGRVWSDLAVVLYLLRADDGAIREHMVAALRDRIQHLLEIEDRSAALAVARAAAELQSDSSKPEDLLPA